MGVRIMENTGPEVTCLYCSTSGVAFGPLIREIPKHGLDAYEAAEYFLRYLADRRPRKDPREHSIEQLSLLYAQFVELTEESLFNTRCAHCDALYLGCWENDETCSEECAYIVKKERYEDGYADYRLDRMKDEGF